MNNKRISYFSLLALVFIFYSSCTKDGGEPSLNVTYSGDIEPLIQAKCVNTGCHSAGGGSSGYDLSTYQLLHSFAVQGRIQARVVDGGSAPNGWMPTTGPLPLLDRKKIDRWLKDGAPNN